MSHRIVIIGHRNPDTDSTTSAVSYARFLERIGRYEEEIQPVVPGEITPQTRWVFEQAGVDLPEQVDTLSPRVKDVMCTSMETLHSSDRLRDAIDLLIRSSHSMIPIVDQQGRLESVFSNREDFSRFLLSLDVAPIAESLLTWEDLCQLPGATCLGRRDDERPCGRIIFAMAAGSEWQHDVCKDDILVAGSIDVLSEVTLDHCPDRVIVVTGSELSARHQERIDRNNLAVICFRGGISDLMFALTRQVRLGALSFDSGLCVGPDDLLQDVRDLVRSQRRALPVVDEDNKLVGIVARKDLKAPPQRKAILIDHFESDQAVPGIESLEIIEIIDHHRIGNIETRGPVRVDCRPIGSACSIVALNYFEAEMDPDPATALLMLGGICADTLVLRGPTTTDRDRQVAQRLAAIAGVDVTAFGQQVLRAGDDLMNSRAEQIWNRDQKVFGIRNQRFAVAQLETVALAELSDEQLQAFRDELQRDFEKNNYLTSLLVVTDVVDGHSWITGCESPGVEGTTELAFGREGESPRPGWLQASNVVSRKKQIIPALMKTFAEYPM